MMTAVMVACLFINTGAAINEERTGMRIFYGVGAVCALLSLVAGVL
jgi:hypothetical protein